MPEARTEPIWSMFTDEEIAEAMNYNVVYIYNIRNGFTACSDVFMRRASRFLDTDYEKLWGEPEPAKVKK